MRFPTDEELFISTPWPITTRCGPTLGDREKGIPITISAAPVSANGLAVAQPIPSPAHVTSATVRSNDSMISLLDRRGR
jgi:hypothetical protein